MGRGQYRLQLVRVSMENEYKQSTEIELTDLSRADHFICRL